MKKGNWSGGTTSVGFSGVAPEAEGGGRIESSGARIHIRPAKMQIHCFERAHYKDLHHSYMIYGAVTLWIQTFECLGALEPLVWHLLLSIIACQIIRSAHHADTDPFEFDRRLEYGRPDILRGRRDAVMLWAGLMITTFLIAKAYPLLSIDSCGFVHYILDCAADVFVLSLICPNADF